MARTGKTSDCVTLLGYRRRSRAALLRSTALQATALAVLATPAAAQLAPNAAPAGGQVAAGAARIGGAGNLTLVTQGSQSAIINWQSYNVGSAHIVQYAQPNTSSLTLNRVIGPDPSQIAGRIIANGKIFLVNQSGVVFAQGSQVDTAGLVVSTAGISDANFLAGKMIFDQAGRAGASISNAGNITVRQAGLAALVAPQVANSGTITAQLGRVILGGAVTHTLDLYGDGLLALNVTGQVTNVSLGGRTVSALVTNSGTILAPGGTVVLSASAVDGVVTTLVSAGGTVSAPSVGAQTGRILVQGVGGGITIDGSVSATGVDAGTVGGQVVANATGTVNLAPGAVIDVSGDTGGGLVAVGTTAARALGGASVPATLTATSTVIASGATLRADATRSGQGGRIVALSANRTVHSGIISIRGGAAGGNGGFAEISGPQVVIDGKVDASAVAGNFGTLSIDPAANLYIADARQGVTLSMGGNSFLASGSYTAAINLALAGGARPNDIDFVFDGTDPDPVNFLSVAGALTGTAMGGINIDRGFAISATASVGFTAGGAIGFDTRNGTGFPRVTPAATLSGGAIVLLAGTGISIADSAIIADAGDVSLTATNGDIVSPQGSGSITDLGGTISFNPNGAGTGGVAFHGVITANALEVKSAGDVVLDNQGNAITTLLDASTNGAFTLDDTGDLILDGDVSGTSVAIMTTGAITQHAATTVNTTTGPLSLKAGTSIYLGGTLTAGAPLVAGQPYTGTVSLTATAGNITEELPAAATYTGIIEAGRLNGGLTSTGGNVDLNTPAGGVSGSVGNAISTLGSFTVGGSFTLEDDTALTIAGPLTAGGSIDVHGPAIGGGGGILVLDSSITSTTGSIAFDNAIGIEQLGGDVHASTGLTLTTSGGAILQKTGDLAGNSILQSDTGTVSLFAGGSYNFGGELTNGIAFGGTLQAGIFTGGIYTGTANLTASAGNITETVAGSTTGTLLVGDLTGSAQTYLDIAKMQPVPGSVALDTPSGTNIGNQIAMLGGFSADGSFTLVDGQPLTVTGNVYAGLKSTSGNPSNLTIYTPGLTVSGSGSLAIAPPPGIAPGVLSLVADHFAFDTADDVTTPGGIVALDLLGTKGSVFLVGSIGTDTVDSASLQNIRTSGGTLALGSLDGNPVNPANSSFAAPITWGVGMGGVVSALTIDTSLDLAATGAADVLGLFSNATIISSAGIVVGGLYGVAGTSTQIAGLNSIGTLGSFQTGSGFGLDDTIALTVNDGATVDGGTGTLSISVTDPMMLTAPSLSLGTQTGTTLKAKGNIALTADGTITQYGGLVESTDGNVTVTSNNGDVAQNGGTIEALTSGPGIGNVSVSAGAVTQQSGAILAAADATVTAQNDVSQSGSSMVDAGYDATVTGGTTLTQTLSSIVGTHGVSILFGSAIVSDAASKIASPGIANDTSSGTVAIVSIGAGISFAGEIAGGGALGTNGTFNASANSAVFLSAGGGDIAENQTGTILAGTLAAGASGNILLNNASLTRSAAANQIGSIASLTSGGITLAGLSAGGTTGIVLTDTTALTIADDASVTAKTIDAPNGAIAITVEDVAGSNPTLTLGTQKGTTLKATGGITLTADGSVIQNGGLIESTTNTVYVTSRGASVLQHGGTVQSDAQDVSVTAWTDISQDSGAIISAFNDVTLAAGTGALATGTGGNITQDRSTISAGHDIQGIAYASAPSGAFGNVAQADASLISGDNAVELASAQGSFTQINSSIFGTNAVTLDFYGSITSDNGVIASESASGTVALASSAGGIAFSGLIDAGSTVNASGTSAATTGTIMLFAGGGAITDTLSIAHGTLVGGTLAASASGSLMLDGGIQANGRIATANRIGTITTLTETLPAVGTIQTHSDVLAGLTAGTFDVNFADAISLTVADGTLIQATHGGIGIDIHGLAGPALTLGTSTGGATVMARDLVWIIADGSVSQNGGAIQSALGTVAITAAVGGIDFTGNIAGGDVFLNAGSGDIAEAGTGSVSAGTLAASGRNILLDNPSLMASSASNEIGTIAGLTVGGITLSGLTADAIVLNDSVGLVIDTSTNGTTIRGDTVAVSTQGDLTETQAAYIRGDTAVALKAGGAIAIDGGVHASPMQTNTPGNNALPIQNVSLTSGTDITVAATGAVTSLGTMTLIAPQNIDVFGTLDAPKIVLGDPATQNVTWENGALITTDSDYTLATRSIAPPIDVNGLFVAAAKGVSVTAADFQQIGTAKVNGPNGAAATAQIDITGTGAASFGDLQAGTTQLLLGLQNGGTATSAAGTMIDVAGLNVYLKKGLTPQTPTQLLGLVGNHGGSAAAAASFAHLVPNVNYQVNGCPIQSINCVLLSPLLVPVANPVQDYVVETARKRRDDEDALPNVGEEDY